MGEFSILSIGDVGLGVSWSEDDFQVTPQYPDFVDQSHPMDIVVKFHGSSAPSALEEAQLLFDSGGVWRLYQQGHQRLLGLFSPAWGSAPYSWGEFTNTLTMGDVFINVPPNSRVPVVLPQYPLDELLVVNALAQERGVLLHGCLINDSGTGRLFVGQSGAGKSTMAALWEQAGVTGIYSDDRVIVREQDGQFWAYGTPWHGTGRYASPSHVPLSSIFVLRQAAQNDARDLLPVYAVSQLFARSFPTFWNREGLDFTLSFLQRLCAATPCYELGFRPTEEVVAFVRGLNGSG